MLHGRARITDGGAAELLHRLGGVYVGPDFVFPVTAPPEAGFVLRTSVAGHRPRAVGPGHLIGSTAIGDAG